MASYSAYDPFVPLLSFGKDATPMFQHSVDLVNTGYESLIRRDARPGEEFQRYIACLNIANAHRDEVHEPLAGRIGKIAEALNKSPTPIDALFVLEAGRSSGGKSWTALAAELESLTGLTYEGIVRTNASPAPLCKALFLRRDRLAIEGLHSEWISGHFQAWCGDRFGIDYADVVFHPVATDENVTIDGVTHASLRRVIFNQQVRVCAFHFPMDLEQRLYCSRWAREYTKGDVLMGDFNTFEGEGGEDMIQEITKHRYVRKDIDVPYTFRGFAHDLVKKPEEFRSQLNSHSEVVSTNDDGTLNVRFASTLDHIFYEKYMLAEVGLNCYVQPMHGASDHDCVVAHIIFK